MLRNVDLRPVMDFLSFYMVVQYRSVQSYHAGYLPVCSCLVPDGLQELKRHFTSHSWAGTGAAGALDAAPIDAATEPTTVVGLRGALSMIGFKGIKEADNQ
jgi:hypothetical protein